MFSRIVIALLLLASVAVAQVSRTGSSIAVIVIDESGAVVPGAAVETTNVENGQKRSVSTAQDGRGIVTDVMPGTYNVLVSSPGFAPSDIRGVELGLGRQSTLAVKLKPEATAQQVTVTASEEAMLDPSQTGTSTSIDQERIEESPVVTRNYLDFVLLAPGLSSSNQRQRTTATNPLEDSGFSFVGQRPRSNTLYIDGVENNDEFTGATRTELSLELVREFQVVNNGLAAEAGGGSGGSINVITRSGVNMYHGDAFIFLQNGSLNAREPFLNEKEKPESNKSRAGLAIGGPIVRDKLFFYAAAEQEHKTDEASSAIDPASASLVNQVLASNVFPGLPVRQLNPGFSPARRAETEASGRLDRQFAASTATLRYSFNNNREAGDAFNSGGLNDASVRGSVFTEDHTLAGAVTSVLSDTLVNDTRIQVSTRRAVLRSNQKVGPEVDIVGIARFGRPYEGNFHRRENHFEAADSVTVSRNQHLIKFGADMDYIHESLSSSDGNGGLYTFLTIAAFANGNPYQFRQRFGSDNTVLDVAKIAGFVQDHWSLTTNLTADLGLRYDYEHLPEPFNEDANNFAPRVGFAYSPVSTWVFRGGFGIFYDRYPLAFLSRGLLNNGSTGFEQIFDLSQAATIFQNSGGGSLASPQGVPVVVYRADPNIRTSYSEQANAGLEHLLFRKTIVTATYLFSRGVHLSRTRNVNLAPPVLLTATNATSLGIATPVPQQIGRPVFAQRLTPGVRDIFQLEDRAGSVYHGGFVGLRSKLSSDFDVAASYTLSKCLDDASDYYEQPENPYTLRQERAPCSFDQRHRFVLSGLVEIGEEKPDSTPSMWSRMLNHIEIAPIVSLGSSRPLNAVTGFDANLSHDFPPSSRPLGFGRNSLRTGKQFSADLRILKYFKIGEHGKLDVVAEGFNLLNHGNVLVRQNEFGPNSAPMPNFLRPVLGGTSRQLQFSLDFEF